MAKATIVKELIVKTPNKVGMMAEVAGAVAKSGANITAVNAFGLEKDAMFRIVTSNNAAVINALKSKNIEASEKDAVRLELADEVGAAAALGLRLKEANIDIKYVYGTVCGCGSKCPCIIVFNTSDNKKAIETLNK